MENPLFIDQFTGTHWFVELLSGIMQASNQKSNSHSPDLGRPGSDGVGVHTAAGPAIHPFFAIPLEI